MRRSWPFVAALLGVSAWIVPLLPLGLGSVDAWGIIQSTNRLVLQGELQVSRPPGHPTVEFLFLPALAKALGALDIPFGSQAYLVQLGLVSMVAVALFLRLLGRAGVSPRDAVLAAAALVISPPFLDQSVNGEEMTWALALLLGAWLLLVGRGVRWEPTDSRARLGAAGLVLALAVGARPEVGVMGLPMAWFLARDSKRPVASLAVFVGAGALALGLLWIPVMVAGSALMPLPLSTDWRMKFAGACYKHLFQVFTFPAAVIFWGGFVAVLFRWRSLPEGPRRLLAVVWMIPVLFAAAFFLYPTKPAFFLPGTTFLLLVLAVSRLRTVLVAGLAALLLGCLVRVDVFRDRLLVGPTLAPGVVQAIVRSKPGGKLDALARATARAREPRTLVLVEPLQPELDWLISQHALTLERVPPEAAPWGLPLYREASAPTSFVAPRNALDVLERLPGVDVQGYTVLLDAEVYRARFSPYALHQQSGPGDVVSLPYAGGTIRCVLY